MASKGIHYESLKNKLQTRHATLQDKIWQKHGEAMDWLSTYAQELAVGSVGGVMLLTSPIAGYLPSGQANASSDIKVVHIDPITSLRADLGKVLPSDVQPLTTDQETQVGDILFRDFGMKVSAELSGIRLNRSYGYIGQEQHLARYPGDGMSSHFESDREAQLYSTQGMAPGLGAWGYFASSRDTMTVKDALREKWYIAVPTFMAPGFADHTGEYISFFKFRKMLVVNTENGRAVVADIGDAGPATFTGKHLGGSPEVMQYLQRVDGMQKGPVLYFFVDDPDDTIPLGPVQIKKEGTGDSV